MALCKLSFVTIFAVFNNDAYGTFFYNIMNSLHGYLFIATKIKEDSWILSKIQMSTLENTILIYNNVSELLMILYKFIFTLEHINELKNQAKHS